MTPAVVRSPRRTRPDLMRSLLLDSAPSYAPAARRRRATPNPRTTRNATIRRWACLARIENRCSGGEYAIALKRAIPVVTAPSAAGSRAGAGCPGSPSPSWPYLDRLEQTDSSFALERTDHVLLTIGDGCVASDRRMSYDDESRGQEPLHGRSDER